MEELAAAAKMWLALMEEAKTSCLGSMWCHGRRIGEEVIIAQASQPSKTGKQGRARSEGQAGGADGEERRGGGAEEMDGVEEWRRWRWREAGAGCK